MRTLFFSTLAADVLVMTMPDLEEFHIKRSPHGVHYAYIHHSLVSTHMVYRPRAFDHFDTIFCAGPHHVAETRAREAQAGLPAKNLIEHGYGRLDAIAAAAGEVTKYRGEAACVIVAPSWGADGLLERHGEAAVAPLIDAGLRVILRPHPRTLKSHAHAIDRILARFGELPQFSLDTDGDATTSLLAADVMVSDWSGAALEFAFGLLRPVVFVDVPRKVNNKDYLSLGLEPVEVAIRRRIGTVLAEDELVLLGKAVLDLSRQNKNARMLAVERDRWVFNAGTSGRQAATALTALLASIPRNR